MKPVRLNRKLTLETPESVADGAGGFTVNWVPLGEHWAEIRAGFGRETPQNFATISAVHYRIVMRAAPFGSPSRPRPEQRLREGNRVFLIQAVADLDPAGRFLTCFSFEEVAS